MSDARSIVASTDVESGEPMDKAGGYGIQSMGGAFVSGIRGCYYNVMGFPMHAFCRRLDTQRLCEWVRQHGSVKAQKKVVP